MSSHFSFTQMHSFFSRLNALFAFTISLTGLLALGLYGTSFFYPQGGLAKLDASKIVV